MRRQLLTDQRSYHALGARLVAGHGFSFADNWYPFTPAETPTAHWSFLYSLFVAGVYALSGAHPLAVRLVQAVLGGLLLPWMVYRLARTLFSDPTRQRTGRWLRPWPWWPRSLPRLSLLCPLCGHPDDRDLFHRRRALVPGARAGAGRPAARASQLCAHCGRSGLALGLSLGLATLLRQSILPWVPVLFLYLLWVGWRIEAAPCRGA